MDYRYRTARSFGIETEDGLLGGRVRLIQPRLGYRVAIDPVLLAASVAVEAGQRILDAGCGTAAAALCLAARVVNPSRLALAVDARVAPKIVGVELDPALTDLARRNVQLNAMDGRVVIVEADFRAFAAEHSAQFDQVMTNPPFLVAGRHSRSPQATRAAAHGEGKLDLADWVKAAATALRPAGRLTLIHRADRIIDILTALDRGFGAVTIFPLWPRVGDLAGRIVVSAIKGRRTPPRLLAGLALHRDDGAYTQEAERVLRDAEELDRDIASS
jgi:tRNA1(Val) A37 N6-methylase TrmN6